MRAPINHVPKRISKRVQNHVIEIFNHAIRNGMPVTEAKKWAYYRYLRYYNWGMKNTFYCKHRIPVRAQLYKEALPSNYDYLVAL